MRMLLIKNCLSAPQDVRSRCQDIRTRRSSENAANLHSLRRHARGPSTRAYALAQDDSELTIPANQ
jgi:hypothetical protein